MQTIPCSRLIMPYVPNPPAITRTHIHNMIKRRPCFSGRFPSRAQLFHHLTVNWQGRSRLGAAPTTGTTIIAGDWNQQALFHASNLHPSPTLLCCFAGVVLPRWWCNLEDLTPRPLLEHCLSTIQDTKFWCVVLAFSCSQTFLCTIYDIADTRL